MEVRQIKATELLTTYSHLLTREYRQWIRSSRSRLAPAKAWITTQKAEILGLIVVDCGPELETAICQTLYYNNIETAKLLLVEVERDLILLGHDGMEGEFEIKPGLKELLGELSWKPLQVYYEEYWVEIKDFNPPWFNPPPTLPDGFKLVRWNERSQQDTQTMEEWAKNEDFYLSEEELFPIEPLNSLILKHKDKIAGWIECHRLDALTVRYTYLFVFPEFRHSGVMLPLLAHSIWIQKTHPIEFAVYEIRKNANFKLPPQSWVTFVKKNLALHTKKIIEVGYSFKMFNML